ncbi:hypothetical protein [Anaerocolumna chitinilytica]|uniref:Phage tail assembly protein n=1 Tax=Anaerocolumna chitinilytica TaxID=1727145 RepID=A0A7I8DIH8_9FIRM|nr:hypothetical protein [Anaerocolumna chitinilytica]BCJ98112.1 hypothetical protein bsdcttw_11530 [Anaerocolumna chitinilytica]
MNIYEDSNELKAETIEETMQEDAEEVGEKEEKAAGVLKLTKPYEINGELTKEISYDLNFVKPIQYINLVTRLGKKESISVPELNINVQIGYFALASGIPVSELKRMPSTQDFTAACSLVRNFLLGTSDMESEEE